MRITIGKAKDNDYQLEKTKVNDHHAVLTVFKDDLMQIEDLDTDHGTYVNGLEIKRKVIKPTDQLKIAIYDVSIEEILRCKNVLDFTSEFEKIQTYIKDIESEIRHLQPKIDDFKKNAERAKIYFLLLILLMGFISSSVSKAKIPELILLAGVGISGLIYLPQILQYFFSPERKKDAFQKKIKSLRKCPNTECNHLFIPTKWEDAVKAKGCPHCNAIWIK